MLKLNLQTFGGRGASSGGGGGIQIQQTPPILQPTPQQAQQANNGTFPDKDSRGYHDLLGGKNYFLSQNMTIDQQIATMNYLEPNPENGSLYSMSQNMNYALANGKKLTANQQYVYNQLSGAMHNLGENLNLTRYDHDGGINTMLKNSGINQSYDKLSLSQLKSALVGKKFQENKFISTSHNDFKNAPTSSKNVFLTRPVKITYKTNADVQAMMPGNGKGGALGEIILAPSKGKDNYKVVDVKYTGQKARQKGTQNYNMPQVELVIEVTKQ